MTITLKDLALFCKVDVSTVSRALRDDPRVALATRQSIQAVAKREGYRVNLAARSLRTGSTQTIWFIASSFQNHLEPSLIQAADEVLAPQGYDLLMVAHRHDQVTYERLLGRLHQGLADAALVTAGNAHGDIPVLRELLQRRYPLVYLDRSPGWPGVPTVTTDTVTATKELVQRLIASGADRIITCDSQNDDVNRLRHATALSAAAACGVKALPVDRVVGKPDWLKGAKAVGIIASAQPQIEFWLRSLAPIIADIPMRFATFDTWVGEPYPAPVAWVAIQDFSAMGQRAAQRLLETLANARAWTDAVEYIPILRYHEVRPRR